MTIHTKIIATLRQQVEGLQQQNALLEEKYQRKLAETTCINLISTMFEDYTADRKIVFEKITKIIPQAFHTPERVKVYICLNEDSHDTIPTDILETYWSVAFLLRGINREVIGNMTLAYKSSDTSIKKNPLSTEEKEFLRSIVNKINYFVGLQDTVQKLKKADQTKSAFISNMNHELRTPLHAVLGHLELLQDEKITEEQYAYVKTARDAAEQMLTQVNNILDTAKLEAQTVQLEIKQFSLQELITEAIQLHHTQTQIKNITIASYFIDELPPVLGDAHRIKQILNNLITNALKFTHKGGRITIIVEKAAASLYILKVSDTGIGISPKQLLHIFERFTQGDENPLTKKHQGTGLGLSICKDLIELMGGSIDCMSTLGKGATFTVKIPLSEAINPTPVQTITDPAIKTFMQPNILVVEDDERNGPLLIRLLAKLNCPADLAASGQAAIDMLQQKKYDLVFMDVHMPHMSGIEATKIIREKIPTAPQIVGLTGDTLDSVTQMCQDAGMNNMLAKPARLTDLSNMLSQYFPEQPEE